ncbi:origin recognition complex subunit 2-domain-containing protein [Lineolata rhizophorae]|uniref:Origin recognition complex subunit 2 n=1 Tax=Lineolata rhizophorae TaxID=578093 RepID=A0A6A6P045_9PEZI|nr:origin recognition complex subunit 2-domain-containing protein [Lineolata rhizophorae]
MKRKRPTATPSSTLRKSRRTNTAASDHGEDELATDDSPTVAGKLSRHSEAHLGQREVRSAKLNGSANGRDTDEEEVKDTPRSQRRVLFADARTPRRGKGKNLGPIFRSENARSGVARNEAGEEEAADRGAGDEGEEEDDDDARFGQAPTFVRNADRSARRKSARRMLAAGDGDSDEDDDAAEEALARQIYASDSEAEGEEELEALQAAAAAGEGDGGEAPPAESVPPTPSKRGRGRPKGSKNKKKRTPSPPPAGLSAQERYFFAHRPGAANKTSGNTLTGVGARLLSHDEYFEVMRGWEDPHLMEREVLLRLHARAFGQWEFEMEQGFSVCLYGFGSKRGLLAKSKATAVDNEPQIVVVNGYAPGLTPRHVLMTILSTLVPASTLAGAKLPAQPAALLDLILSTLSSSAPSAPSTPSAPPPLTLLIPSLDAPPLRRPATQALLASLAAHPRVRLLATVDTPNFALLWDQSLRARFRWLFHDCTTFAPFGGVDAVAAVDALLGRSGRRVTGRDGVAYVLRSLPERARGLFRMVVAEQLAGMIEAEGFGGDEDGVEYRVLYHKAVEDFVCSNEVQFRTLLKEFYDHQMLVSRRDALGTERLAVPFRREELELLLEELM